MLIYSDGKEHKNITKYYKVLTNLIVPNLRVTLSQVPPSQKEMQGVEGTLHFHTHPHANSKKSFVACEPANVLC